MNIKSLIQTGLYREILKKENLTLSAQEQEHLEHSEGIFGTMLEEQTFVKLAELLKPRIVIKSGSDMIDQGMIEEILEPI